MIDKVSVRIIQMFLGLFLIGSVLVILSGLLNERKLHTIRHAGKVIEGEILDSGKLEQPSGIKTHYLKVRFVQEEEMKLLNHFP